jgi:hypothetical protein
MAFTGLSPKYVKLLGNMNEKSQETMKTNEGKHSTLCFIVSKRRIDSIMGILFQLFGPSGRYDTHLSFKDWDVDWLHVTLLDPQPNDQHFLYMAFKAAHINAYEPKPEVA